MFSKAGVNLLFYAISASQISLGIVFLLSALPKLRRPLLFARSVVEYKVLPKKLAYGFAFVVIPLEAFSAIAFLTGWFIGVAIPIAIAMLLAFLVAVGINLRRGRKISCGCFGEANEEISPRTLARLGVLLAVLLFLIAFGGTDTTTSLNLVALPVGVLLPILSLAVFLLLMGLWILNIPELIFLVRWSQ